MRMYCPNKSESCNGFLFVYGIMRSHGNNVGYKLHYFYGVVVIYWNARYWNSNHICYFNIYGVSKMLPPVVCRNAPVRLKDNSLRNDVTVLLGLFHNLNCQPFLGYDKEVYYIELHPTPFKSLPYYINYTWPPFSIVPIYCTDTSIFLMCTFEDLELNVH